MGAGVPYIGEIRMFAGNFAPEGWAFCNGQILLISQFDVLFSLIGTTFGGDGVQNFALPDLRGRIPIHRGDFAVLGQAGGAESVTLTLSQIPSHAHAVMCHISEPGNRVNPAGNVWAADGSGATLPFGFGGAGGGAMAADATGQAGGSQAHENMPPFLALSFIISLFGIFPSPS